MSERETLLERFNDSARRYAEFRAAMDEINDATKPLVDMVRAARPVRIKRIRLSPFCYRRLMDLLERKSAAAVKLGIESPMPSNVPLQLFFFNILIEEGVQRREG